VRQGPPVMCRDAPLHADLVGKFCEDVAVAELWCAPAPEAESTKL